MLPDGSARVNPDAVRGMGQDDVMDSIEITGDDIRLGQFLKLVGAVDVGAHVKQLLSQERVRVNGDIETRRGRRLVRADVVTVDDTEFVVS